MAQAEQVDIPILASGTGGKLLAAVALTHIEWLELDRLTMAEDGGELFARIEQAP